jgi:hypothetical protein
LYEFFNNLPAWLAGVQSGAGSATCILIDCLQLQEIYNLGFPDHANPLPEREIG